MTTTRSDDVGPMGAAEVEQLIEDLQAQKEELRATVSTLERELRQARRLEVIGRLTGGVAHDFNNLLMGVDGCLDVALNKLDSSHAARKYLQEAKRAIATGATITRQLLMFTRQREAPQVVQSLDKILNGTVDMLRRLLDTNIELQVIPAAAEGKVCCPEGAIEEIVMNLVVSARDGMTDGGRITIESSVVTMDEHHAIRHVGSKPGSYLTLQVVDNGAWLDRETQAHIFEPAFSAKSFGKRAGLGLATVYSLVKQSGGYIEVTSKKGLGTTFTMYFPRVTAAATASSTLSSDPIAPAAPVALVVDDEPMIRLYIRCMMERLGYGVLEASDGAAALQLCRQREQIDILLTDVFLPGIQGVQLGREIKLLKPNSTLLFMSAYPAETLLREGRLEPGMIALQKPFSEANLQSALDLAASRPAAPQPKLNDLQ